MGEVRRATRLARRGWVLTGCVLAGAQVNLKVNHCLLALPGVKREDVKRVMSHPQARRSRRGATLPPKRI